MYATESDRPGLDEQYLAAQNTSDLTVDPNRRGAVDHLIAAALAGNRMADALNSLRSQWDRADKPPKATQADIEARAFELPKKKGKPDFKRARVEATVTHAGALRAVYLRLPGRAQAIGLLTEWAGRRSVDPDLLSPALYHWLNPACPACEGRGKVTIPDTPMLGGDCHHCAGTGKWPRPLGAERIDSFLKGCISRAKQERKQILHGGE